MAFEKFRYKNWRVGGAVSPGVSVSSKGTVSFNPLTREHFGDCGFASLYFDRERNTVAVKPIPDIDQGIEASRLYKRGSTTLFTCKRFFAWAGYDCDQLRHFDASWNDQHAWFEFDLGKPLDGK